MIAESKVSLINHLKKVFGFDKFKGRQEAIVNNLMSGNDTFVIMPTGGGKSLCYQLPALICDGTAVIVSPLIALMKNQVDTIRGHSSQDGIAHFFNSTLSKSAREKVKSDTISGITKLLYVAPESLTKEENIQFLSNINISFFAIDEAHCISEWGHDFRPEYRRLRPIIEEIERVPIIALTATATPKVQHDILKNLGMLDAKVFTDSFNRKNLYYEIRPKNNVNKEIIKYAKKQAGKSGIVYCQSRKKVEEIAKLLQLNGVNAVPYHAGFDAKTRSRYQDMFLMEEVEIIVATIAFGMGIDKPDIRFIVHHDIPKSLESYYQETGRAGRDGGEGKCIAFYTYQDILKLEKLLSGKPIAEQEITKLLMQEVVSFSETSECRRRFLLHYFGENYTEENCENCDNCLNPKERFDAREHVLLLLELMKTLKAKFKENHLVNILTGKITSNIKQYKHHLSEFFAKGDYENEAFWRAIIRQSLVNNFLCKEIENYGTLYVSEMGNTYLKHPETIMYTRDHDYDDADDDEGIISQSKSGGALDSTLLGILKDLRKKTGAKNNLPPYIIFQDPSLDEMASMYPITVQEIAKISGVGEGKAKKYGAPFAEVIAKYVEENNIERPFFETDSIKSLGTKETNIKKDLIIIIDKRQPLEDFAKSKGIEMIDVLNELESIVKSGTKLNINYYVEEVFDDDDQEDIFEILRSTTDDTITPLFEEYADVYEEDELRLIKIKFLSDLGN